MPATCTPSAMMILSVLFAASALPPVLAQCTFERSTFPAFQQGPQASTNVTAASVLPSGNMLVAFDTIVTRWRPSESTVSPLSGSTAGPPYPDGEGPDAVLGHVAWMGHADSNVVYATNGLQVRGIALPGGATSTLVHSMGGTPAYVTGTATHLHVLQGSCVVAFEQALILSSTGITWPSSASDFTAGVSVIAGACSGAAAPGDAGLSTFTRGSGVAWGPWSDETLFVADGAALSMFTYYTDGRDPHTGAHEFSHSIVALQSSRNAVFVVLTDSILPLAVLYESIDAFSATPVAYEGVLPAVSGDVVGFSITGSGLFVVTKGFDHVAGTSDCADAPAVQPSGSPVPATTVAPTTTSKSFPNTEWPTTGAPTTAFPESSFTVPTTPAATETGTPNTTTPAATETDMPTAIVTTTQSPGSGRNSDNAPVSNSTTGKVDPSISAGLAAGLTLLGVALLGAVVVGAVLALRRRRRRRREAAGDGTDEDFTAVVEMEAQPKTDMPPSPADGLTDTRGTARSTATGMAVSTTLKPPPAYVGDGTVKALSVSAMSAASTCTANNSSSRNDEKRHSRVQRYIEQKSFQKGKLIGRGANGSVYGVLLKDGSTIAMKEVNLIGDEGDIVRQMAEVEREMALLRTLHHDNLVTYYAVEMDTAELRAHIFMENVTGGSLATLVRSMPGPLPEATAATFTNQILAALCYIHEKHVLHRDLKCDNVLRDAHTGTVKLADFGTARTIDKTLGASKAAQTMIGTPFFMAPEILAAGMGGSVDGGDDEEGGYGVKADIWSLGITVGELLNRGNPPWPAFPSPGHAFLHIANPESEPLLPEGLSEMAVDFIRQCTRRNPRERPTARELLEHPWILLAPDSDDDEDGNDNNHSGSGSFK